MNLDRRDRDELEAILGRTNLFCGKVKVVLEFYKVYVLSESFPPYCGRDSEWRCLAWDSNHRRHHADSAVTHPAAKHYDPCPNHRSSFPSI